MHYVSISPLGSTTGPVRRLHKAVYHHIRGGVQSEKNNEYLLEIANTCMADSELLALCALAPEIREFLEMFDSPLAEMLLAKWTSLELKLHIDQRQPDKSTHPWTDTGD